QHEPVPAFDAAGDALIANADTRHVAYRSANGADVSDEVMDADTQNRPVLVSVAPTGEAMLGFQASDSGGAVKVAFRAAGADQHVDEEHAETFDTGSVLIGLQLQDDG